MGERTPLVKADGHYKVIGGVDVLKNADLELLPGEIQWTGRGKQRWQIDAGETYRRRAWRC
jgi:hypothetical protein